MDKVKIEIKQEIEECSDSRDVKTNLKNDKDIKLNVRMSSGGGKKFYLLEHSLTPESHGYVTEDIKNVKIKPENRLIEMEMMEPNSSEISNFGYPKSRKKKPRRRCRAFTEAENKLRSNTKLRLRSVPGKKAQRRNILLGRIVDDSLHFVPLHDYVKMRPTFKNDEDVSKEEKLLKVKTETHYQRQRRLRSKKWQDECIAAENWRDCSIREVEMDLQPPEEEVTVDHKIVSQMEYIRSIVPDHTLEFFLEKPRSDCWDINAVNYAVEIGHPLSLSDMCQYFDSTIEPVEILRRVLYCAHLLKDNIVLHSEFSYTKDFKPLDKSDSVERLRLMRNYYFGVLALKAVGVSCYGLHRLTGVSLTECQDFISQFDQAQSDSSVSIGGEDYKSNNKNLKFVNDSVKKLTTIRKNTLKAMKTAENCELSENFVKTAFCSSNRASRRQLEEYSHLFELECDDEQMDFTDGVFFINDKNL